MKDLMIRYHLDYAQDNNSCLPSIQKELYSLISLSKIWYPDIFHWYLYKFVPGLNDGSRNILIYIVDNKVAGIALIKNGAKEKKICTFRVKYDYRNNGIGKTLFRKCLETLDTDKPVFTVPAERFCYFSNILKYYNFRLEQVVQNYYMENSSEYVFNGNLGLERMLNNIDKNIYYESTSGCSSKVLSGII